ncbi:hypothetical protein BsWGS_25543 [Bradybaena similaris]
MIYVWKVLLIVTAVIHLYVAVDVVSMKQDGVQQGEVGRDAGDTQQQQPATETASLQQLKDDIATETASLQQLKDDIATETASLQQLKDDIATETASLQQLKDDIATETASLQQLKDDIATETASLQQLKDDIAKTLACYRNPGLAVSVVKNGKIVLSEGFGVTSPNKRSNVTSKTLFSIASLTKAFTAALILNALAKNGSVKLSSTVREVVGNDFRFNDTQRTEYATIEDLLTYRLRVPGNDEFRFNPKIDRQELLKRVRFFESSSEFRVKGTYSSTNYIMAAAITELISNSTWEELMNQTLLRPLGMTSQFAAAVNFDDENVAPPYSTYAGQEGYINPDFTKQWNSQCGAGCLFSNADDMAKWMNFHLTKGKDVHGHVVFPETYITELHSPRSLLPSSDVSLEQRPKFPVTQTGDLYALGWRVGHYRGYKIVFHTGSTPGYASMLTLVPSEGVGVFIAMNGDDDGVYYRMSLQNYILDFLLSLEPWLNTSTVCSFPQPWHPRNAEQTPVYAVGLKPSRSWMDYAGVYGNEGYGDVIVEFNTTLDGLTARFGFGSWQLHAQTTPDLFYGKGLGINYFFDMGFVQFQAASDLITHLVVKGFNRPLPPVFTKLKHLQMVMFDGNSDEFVR